MEDFGCIFPPSNFSKWFVNFYGLTFEYKQSWHWQHTFPFPAVIELPPPHTTLSIPLVDATQSDVVVGCCWPVMKNLLRHPPPISSHKEREAIPSLVASDREQDGRSYPRHCVRPSPDDRWKLLAGAQTVSMLVQDPILKLYIINSFNRQ